MINMGLTRMELIDTPGKNTIMKAMTKMDIIKLDTVGQAITVKDNMKEIIMKQQGWLN